MSDPYRLILVGREWSHYRFVTSAVRERFPEAAVYSADSASKALDLLSCRRFDLVLVEGNVLGGAHEAASAIAASAPGVRVEVLGSAPSDGELAMPWDAVEVAQLVAQHLKGQ
jgi:hypothetical protein